MPPIFDRILTLNLVANTVIFYIAARLYLLPQLPRFSTATNSSAHSASAFDAPSVDDVSNPRRHLSGTIRTVRLSRSIRRFARRGCRARNNPISDMRFPCSQAGGVVLQHPRHDRSAFGN